jgi:nucleotidyltransferase/DNA polymerase involved in DNA repair
MNNNNILSPHRSIIKEYDPFFTSHSLDEVYMDLTAAAIARVENPNINFNSTSSCSSSSAATLEESSYDQVYT